MTTTSTFPGALDTDANLYRVAESDVLIPAHLNNKTDALQQVEGTVGVIPGTTINTGLAHFAQMPSVSMPNPRYPWVPVNPISFYPSSGVAPAAWTITPGVLAYNAPVGLGKVAVPATTGTVLASVALTGVRPFSTIYRIHITPRNLATNVIWFGHSVAGNASDLCGISIRTEVDNKWVVAGVYNGAITGGELITYAGPWLHVWHEHTSSTHTVKISNTGYIWDRTVFTQSLTTVPTTFLMCTPVSPAGPATTVWLDYCAFGNAAPVGIG